MAVDAGEIEATLKLRDEMSRQLQGIKREVGGLGGMMQSAVGVFSGFLGAQAVMNGVSAAFSFAKDAAIGMNATLETSELQFATLMGDATRAKEQVAFLFEFAKSTPFETGPIIEASRIMETFGGSTLNSRENLQLFGDAAAATSAPINEVAMWSSRMYAALEAGKPFGEAAARLGELAVMTPKTRMQLEEMQKSGRSGKEVWAEYQASLGRFTGAMEKQAGTWSGVMSTFTDTVNILVAGAMKPLFESLRDTLGGLNAVLGDDSFARQAQGLSAAIGQGVFVAVGLAKDAFAVLKIIADGVLYVWHDLVEVGKDLAGAFGSLGGQSEVVTAIFGGLVRAGKGVWDIVVLIVQVAIALADKLGLLRGITAIVQTVMVAFTTILGGVGNALSWVSDKIRWLLESVGLLDKSIEPAQARIKETATTTLPAMSASLASVGATAGTAGASVETFGTKSEASTKKAAAAAKELGEMYAWVREQHNKEGVDLMNAEADAMKRQAENVALATRAWAPFASALQYANEQIGANVTYDLAATSGLTQFGMALTALPPKVKSAGESVAQTFGQSFVSNISSSLAGLPNVIMAAFTGGGDVGKSIGGSVVGNLFSVEGPIGKLFGQGGDAIGRLIGGNMGKKLGETFGSLAGPLGTLLGGMAGELIGPLINKVGGFFKNLFGGPNGVEVEGRKAAQSFREQLAQTLTSTQKAEAGTDEWKKSVIAVRDAYIAAGKTEADALAIMDALWKAEKAGGQGVAAVIAEIEANMQAAKAATVETTTAATEGFKETAKAVEETSKYTGVMRDEFLRWKVDAEKPVLTEWVTVHTTINRVLEEIGSNQGWQSGSSSMSADDKLAAFLRNNPGDYDRAAAAIQDDHRKEAAQRNKPGSGFATGTPGLGFMNFGRGTNVTLHGREAVVPEGRADEFAARFGKGEHGEGFNHMLATLVSIERQNRDMDRRIGVAVEDALTLSRGRR